MNEKLRIAEQTLALLAKHNHNNGHTREAGYEMLDQLQLFVDKCLDDESPPEAITIEILNQYVVPHWHHIDIPFNGAHVELAHTFVDDWICQYHEQQRTD